MKSDWQTKRLDDACEVEYGTRVVNKKHGGSKYPVYGGGGATFFMDRSNRENRMVVARFAMSEQCTRFVTGEFFLNDSGLTVAPKSCRVIAQGFLDWQMLFLNDKIYSLARGSAQKNLDVPAFRNMEISFPESLTEQKRIVKTLDEVFEKVATAKENAEKNLKNSKELFESYLQSVFTNRGKDWEKQSLSNVCEVEYGYTEKAKSDGDYRFVRITDTDENGLLTQENKMYVRSFDGANKYLLNDGDLLMARTGASAGNVLFFESDEKAIFASYLIRLKFKKEVSSKLYWFFSKSKLYWDQVKQLSAGSAQPQFNGGALKKITFPFPKSLHEQKAIIKKLDALSVETKKLEKIYEQKLVDLEELKKSILSGAFKGGL